MVEPVTAVKLPAGHMAQAVDDCAYIPTAQVPELLVVVLTGKPLGIELSYIIRILLLPESDT